MKKIVLLSLIALLTAHTLSGTTYRVPSDKRPAVSLAEAEAITRLMLKSQGLDEKYITHMAVLNGNQERSEAGVWLVFLLQCRWKSDPEPHSLPQR